MQDSEPSTLQTEVFQPPLHVDDFQNPNPSPVLTGQRSCCIFVTYVYAPCGQCVETSFAHHSECVLEDTSRCVHPTVQDCDFVWCSVVQDI